MPELVRPRVTDNDKGEITITYGGKMIRGWSYSDSTEQMQKMIRAREYIEGWCDGKEAQDA